MGASALLMAFAMARPHRRLRRRRQPMAAIGLLIEFLFFYGGISLALVGLLSLYKQ